MNQHRSKDENFDLFEWRQANPFAQGVPSIMSLEDMKTALSHDPRSAWPRPPSTMAEMKREAWGIKNRFVATKYCSGLGERLLLALHVELEKRDPRSEINRKLNYVRSGFADMTLKDIPWEASGAPGFVLEGPTGESKSMFVERFTSLIPQVLHRPEDTESGWLSLTQITWLKVPMPTSKSVKGFILELATALDTAAGTSYALQLATRSSTDKQLVMLLIWMNLHKVSFLAIEEAQEEFLGGTVIAKELLLFFLKVLNWGIVVLLVGNPKALEVVKTFVQDNRRFSDGGWYTVLPVLHWEDEEWSEHLVPGIWGYNVLPEKDEPLPKKEELLYRATGGQRYALARLRRESLLFAIDDRSTRVTRRHVLTARYSPSMQPLRTLIDALVFRDVGILGKMQDYPTDTLVAAWKLDAEIKQIEA